MKSVNLKYFIRKALDKTGEKMLRKMLILFLGIISIVTVYETNNQVYAQEKAKITICSFKNYFKGDNINLGEGEYIKAVTYSKFGVFYVENKDYNKASLEAMNLSNLEKKSLSSDYLV